MRQADLSKPETLDECLEGTDVIVHFAGVLFKAKPEKFLYQTNIQYFDNLVQIAAKKNKKSYFNQFSSCGRSDIKKGAGNR